MKLRKTTDGILSFANKTPMPHESFIDRIRKSLYFGMDTMDTEMEVSRPLAEYASELFSLPHQGHSLNRLSTIAAGSVHATPCSLIMALIYLDRLNVLDPGYARRITPQELFIVSMMISTKFYAGHDEEIYLSDWAEDGELSEVRLKQLEIEFLCAIEWNIYISNEQFFNKLKSIEKILAKREGLRRGWLTYTELAQMLPSFALAKFILNHIALVALSYAASVMTIAGAFFLVSQIPASVMLRKTTANTTHPTVSVTSKQNIPMDPLDSRTLSTNGLDTNVDSVTLALGTNSSCLALNVEEELLKLERQYREEIVLNDRRSHRNEIASESRLTLPEGVTALSEHSVAMETDTAYDVQATQRSWLVMKEEFEEIIEQNNLQINSESFCAYQNKWKGTLNNCSCPGHLLTDTVDRSFIHLPMMWFKFI